MLRAGGKCARPECSRDTLGPSKERENKGQIVGQAAHMRAASPKGPRFDSSQSDEERHSAANGIWLCEYCAALIDKNNGVDFRVETLQLWKDASERAALERLTRQSESIRENCVSSLIFINIPRLHHLMAQTKQPGRLPNFFDEGIPGDGYIAPQLYELQKAIARMRFPALNWQEIADKFDDPTGLIVSFEGRFRTKNGPKSRSDRRERDLTDLQTAPHIYQTANGHKLILPYDPKFLTTSTAGVEMTRGQCNVGGFASIKHKDGKNIIASPFIIGLFSSPEGRAFMDALAAHQRN